MDFPFYLLECLGLIVVSKWQSFKDVVVAKSNFHRLCVGVLEICFPDSCLCWSLFKCRNMRTIILTTTLEISHLHFIFSTVVAKSVYLLVSLCFHRGCHFKWTFSLCAPHFILSDDITGARQTCRAQVSIQQCSGGILYTLLLIVRSFN